MQLDFHYYCVAVLARAAGFDNPEALRIAYASQFVDDSTESDLIPISSGYKKINFEPVLTTYQFLEARKSFEWSAQKRVWVSFHFLPAEPFRPRKMDTFSFVTRSGSKFGQLLLKKAASERSARRRTCRIGIALHTYADTWSHSGFSGRRPGRGEPMENNVEGIHVYNRLEGKWNKLAIENVAFDFLPLIGHAQAGQLPDLSFLKWKFRLKPSQQEIERDNKAEFLNAAESIYNLLVPLEKMSSVAVIPWREIGPTIQKLLSNSGERVGTLEGFAQPEESPSRAPGLEKRCANWKREFGSLFGEYSDQYFYDRNAWWREAFGKETRPDSSPGEGKLVGKPYEYKEGFWDSYWVHFHRAALIQRHFVLENLP